MFAFPDYSYNRYAYNMRRPQPSPRSSYYHHPVLSSLIHSPHEYDYALNRARHQQQKEEEQRNRMQRQQVLDERLRQRQLDEMEARDEERRQRSTNANVHIHENTSGLPFPPGTILRGRDGRLYRVVNRPSHLRKPTSSKDTNADDSSFLSEHSHTDNASVYSDSSMANAHSDIEAIDDVYSGKNVQFVKVTPIDKVKHNSAKEEDHDAPNENYNNQSTLTLVVEDVPMEEDEELRDLYSIWRNRIPSPGQWMEPIDNFDNQ